MYSIIPIVVLVILFLVKALKVLNEYERGVIFRLGRVIKAKGPGLIILVPVVDKMVKVSMRLVAMDVDPQDVITRDNVSVKVNAVIYFRVIDPIKAIVEVENYSYAMAQLAQTTLRSVCGRRNSTNCWRPGIRSTPSCRRSSTRRPTPGASRWPRWSSSTSICPRRCSAPWPNRPRPSASGGPR